MDASEFDGRIAVVTGAACGIGKAVANALRQAGATVAALDIAFKEDDNGQFVVDVADSEAVNKAISAVERQLGDIDYLVNVAGVLHLAPLLECSDEVWQRTFAVNTTGAFNLCRAVGRRMALRRRGAIVVVGSNAAHVPRIGMGAYAAAKAATSQMLKCLGLELAQANIRCNIVAPGSTDTNMQRQLWSDANGPATVIAGSLEHYRLGIPLQRIASAENIASVVLFLLSSHAAHITLEAIVVDGGATLGC